MDCDRLEEIFGDLKAYRIPAEQEQLFAKLRDASLMYDYEEICALLSEQS